MHQAENEEKKKKKKKEREQELERETAASWHLCYLIIHNYSILELNSKFKTCVAATCLLVPCYLLVVGGEEYEKYRLNFSDSQLTAYFLSSILYYSIRNNIHYAYYDTYII